jgi:hypothetical protein
VFLDGADTGAQREHGTRELLDALGRSLERETVKAQPGHGEGTVTAHVVLDSSGGPHAP